MKQTSDQRNVTVFSVTLVLILLLALGVYASNRLLTHWLLVRSLDQTITLVPVAVDGAGLSAEFAASFAGQTSNAGAAGLRLSLGTADTTERAADMDPDRVMSPRLRQVVSAALKPAPLLADQYIGFSAYEAHPATFPARLRAALHAGTEDGSPEHVSKSAVATALDKLEDAKDPYSVIDMHWWGGIKPLTLAVFPSHGEDGRTVGALVLLLNQEHLIAGLERITRTGSALIAALCGLSIVFAGLLLWLRFSDQVKTNRDIEYLAHHDTLTGLPNRAVFNARLNESLRVAQAKASNMGVMLIDVDKFKDINDTYGHGTGDIFLQIIADRLRSVFGEHLVARLSGDEFAVMTQSVSDVGRLTRLAADMLAATEDPCVIDGKEIKISLSIGIARASDGSWRASRLLHCADLALYRAKHSGRSTFSWYTPDMDADAQKRKEIEEGLVKALKFDQFKLLFQPQYSLADNELRGYESLIRWEHPIKGSISPDVFIPVAEDTGLIESIGEWVLNRACMEAAGWSDPSLRVAVNVSGAQFKAGETDKKVARALQMSGLDPSRLEIEITESLLISNTDAVVETLQEIRKMGVSIAMDDFGTGYSSLSYLSRFPFDKIKIDRSFIHNLGKDAGTDAIVASIVGLGRSLDVLITAEGVENEEQVVLLRAAGCHLVQGYLYGRPATVESHELKRARAS
ncbi:MAG: bifunctional diguanylate cyclase/phosphodiesterase [Roseibium sp.]|nr:bifunctional diguanylate cyclase/phosphodiesterase [Roseibium sp.]